jgi:ribosome maturation factor RimP
MTGIGEQPIAQRVATLLEPLVAREGFELCEVEWQREGQGWVLRLFVDRPGGVNVDHCQELSRTVETVLDVEELIEPAYSLEVSSPGVERPLRKPEHFQRFAGQQVVVKAFGPVDAGHGPRKSWTGLLKGFEQGAVLVEVEGKLHRIPHGKIAKAHVAWDFEADLRRKE